MNFRAAMRRCFPPYFLAFALVAGMSIGATIHPDKWQTYDLDKNEAEA